MKRRPVERKNSRVGKLAALLAAALCLASAQALDISTLSGKTYKDVKVVKTDPAGITIVSDGVRRYVKFSDLDESLKEKFGYDPDQEKAYIDAKGGALEENVQQAEEPQKPEGQPPKTARSPGESAPEKTTPPERQAAKKTEPPPKPRATAPPAPEKEEAPSLLSDFARSGCLYIVTGQAINNSIIANYGLKTGSVVVGDQSKFVALGRDGKAAFSIGSGAGLSKLSDYLDKKKDQIDSLKSQVAAADKDIARLKEQIQKTTKAISDAKKTDSSNAVASDSQSVVTIMGKNSTASLNSKLARLNREEKEAQESKKELQDSLKDEQSEWSSLSKLLDKFEASKEKYSDMAPLPPSEKPQPKAASSSSRSSKSKSPDDELFR